MRRFVVGTGGHVDHGKTALVAALTGEDTDRLPEEKARGISIDLGFSHLDLDDGILSIVDVPGHEDFIRNMLAGASGIDVLLLVVAADEGVMPQTREHVTIAELLAVPEAVVALTKVDLVEAEWLELVRQDVAELLAGTRYTEAPVLATSAVTGAGLPELQAALLGSARTTREDGDLFRLPVDRSFTIRGTGTVVTGTVRGGALALDEEVRILPGGSTARVRSLQVHGRETGRVAAGDRAAVALGGVDVREVGRGATLVTDPAWAAASMLTVRLGAIGGLDGRIRQRQRVRVHLGTAEVMARVRLLEGAELGPAEEAWAQLRLEAPLVARAGDRVVVRSYSPVTTIGGGRVAEAGERKRKRLRDGAAGMLAALAEGPPQEALRARLRAAGLAGAELSRLPVEIAVPPGRVPPLLESVDADLVGSRAFRSGAGDEVVATLRSALDLHHSRHPLEPDMDLEELRRAAPADAAAPLVEAAIGRLRSAAEVAVREGRVAAASFTPRLTDAEERRKEAILAVLRAAGAEAPTRDEIADAVELEEGGAAAGAAGSGAGGGAGGVDEVEALLRLLEREGRAVRIGDGLHMDRAALDSIVAAVRERLGGGDGLGPADFRAVVPVSRKYLIPILEHLDALSVTVRRGEGRAVPRATDAAAGGAASPGNAAAAATAPAGTPPA